MRENSDKIGWCGTFLDVRAGPAKLKINFTRPNEIKMHFTETQIFLFIQHYSHFEVCNLMLTLKDILQQLISCQALPTFS